MSDIILWSLFCQTKTQIYSVYNVMKQTNSNPQTWEAGTRWYLEIFIPPSLLTANLHPCLAQTSPFCVHMFTFGSSVGPSRCCCSPLTDPASLSIHCWNKRPQRKYSSMSYLAFPGQGLDRFFHSSLPFLSHFHSSVHSVSVVSPEVFF